MGLSLRTSLLRHVDAPSVYASLERFYGARGERLVEEQERARRFDLRETANGWTALDWDGGWEWVVRRDAQRFVSRELETASLLVFVYDGDYWGYELFDRGSTIDHFLQVRDEALDIFEEGRGDATRLGRAFGVDPARVAPYLVPQPEHGYDHSPWSELDGPALPGDQFSRWDGRAVMDFVRALGVPGDSSRPTFRIGGPIWRSFRPVGA
ncbi:MAG: hypothetical protein AAGH15_16750 [Myxococcota bacterium]